MLEELDKDMDEFMGKKVELEETQKAEVEKLDERQSDQWSGPAAERADLLKDQEKIESEMGNVYFVWEGEWLRQNEKPSGLPILAAKYAVLASTELLFCRSDSTSQVDTATEALDNTC